MSFWQGLEYSQTSRTLSQQNKTSYILFTHCSPVQKPSLAGATMRNPILMATTDHSPFCFSHCFQVNSHFGLFEKFDTPKLGALSPWGALFATNWGISISWPILGFPQKVLLLRSAQYIWLPIFSWITFKLSCPFEPDSNAWPEISNVMLKHSCVIASTMMFP